jgi:hypothetical protein
MLGRGAGGGESWSTNRHASDAGVCHGAEGAAHKEDGEGAIVVCSEESAVGFVGKGEAFLRCGSFVDVGPSYGPVLYQEPFMGYVFRSNARGGGGQSQRVVRSAERVERGSCGEPSVTLPERGSAQRDKPLSAPGDAALTWQHRRASEPRWDKIRLSRQSLRNLVYWRSLTRGEGRDLHPPPADLTMHSDAADVGHGGTLGMYSKAGCQGL